MLDLAAHDIEGLPTTPAGLLRRLDDIGVSHRTVAHPPVFTVEQAKQHRGELAGAHIKNLFLRNRKEEMWLVVLLEDTRVDLKRLGEVLGAGKLSFGSAERLLRALGVKPGSVTPFALINDHDRQVRLAVERRVLDLDPVNAHPLVNSLTTAVSPQGLLRFFAATRHEPKLLDL